jgi:predicted ATPase/class 3 adenylate cyclase
VGRIPSGTITLLFSDIAGSTRLWETEPDAMTVALRRHDDIMRSVIEGAGGYVFKTVGDAFCAAFDTAQQAVMAAVRAQLDLPKEPWPTDPPVRVRIALHTGVCEERDGDYFGPTVNRVARLEAIAHGGQTVASGATAELVDESLPEGVRLRDLGTHRLRDLGRPEHVFQVDVAGLPASFPPLESLDSPELPNNLPGLLSTFVGRSAELAAIRGQLAESRLLTLTGAGGCGKTRLALHAAAEQLDSAPDGVWLIELAALTDPGAIPAAMAAVLGLPSRSESALLAALHEQDALLVLDNCEHMIEDAAKLCDRITRDCRRVRILATSREPLGIDGERVYRVASLSLPGPDESSTSSEAVELFAERARAQDPGFVLDDETTPLAASVCRRLDGIPLAIELAAARLKSMSLSQVSARLDQRFRLLTGGSRNVMPRQQTLQATVDWSFGLLSEAERETLRRMSVFTGGFELEAAEAVRELDTFEVLDLLGSLVDKSLVVAERSERAVRYRLLETIRQYCIEELLRTDGDDAVLAIRAGHAGYYLALAETAAPELTGPAQAAWLRRLDPEWENLRAAFGYFADEERTADVLRLGIALERLALTRGHVEMVYWLRAVIERADSVPDLLLAGALLTCSTLTNLLLIKDPAERAIAKQYQERALELARSLGDRQLQARALDQLSVAAFREHDPVTMKRLSEEATEIAQQLGDLNRIASLLGTMELDPETSLAESGRLCQQALDYNRQTGDQLGVANALYRLHSWHVFAGQPAEGRPHLDEALAMAAEIGASHFVYLLQGDLCVLLLMDGNAAEAAPLVQRNLRIAHRMGDGQGVAVTLFCAACCASWLDPGETAAQLYGATDAEIKAALADGTMVAMSDLEQDLRATSQDRLRELMGDAAFEAAYRTGAQLTRMQAVELALGRNTQAVLKLALQQSAGAVLAHGEEQGGQPRAGVLADQQAVQQDEPLPLGQLELRRRRRFDREPADQLRHAVQQRGQAVQRPAVAHPRGEQVQRLPVLLGQRAQQLPVRLGAHLGPLRLGHVPGHPRLRAVEPRPYFGKPGDRRVRRQVPQDAQLLLFISGRNIDNRRQCPERQWRCRLRQLPVRRAGGPPVDRGCRRVRRAVGDLAAQRVPLVVGPEDFLIEGDVEGLLRAAARVQPADKRRLEDLQRIRRGGRAARRAAHLRLALYPHEGIHEMQRHLAAEDLPHQLLADRVAGAG